MKKTVFFWQALGWVFTGIAGVLLHFVFSWTEQSVLVAPFAPVNESIWEHMKLLFFPMVLFAVVESRYIGKEYKNFWCAKLIGTGVGTITIPVMYYTINGIFGTPSTIANIAIFYMATTLGYALEYRLMKKGFVGCKSPKIAIGVLVLMALCFAVWTFMPPQTPLFLDPITNTYGYYQIK